MKSISKSPLHFLLVLGVTTTVIFTLTISFVSAQVVGLISIDSFGAPGEGDADDVALSSDGRYVAFLSEAPNLVAGDLNDVIDVFVHDIALGVTTRVNVSSLGVEANGESDDVSISSDGRYVAFRSSATNLVAGDLNGVTDVFVHDRTTGATERVSIDSAGTEANLGSFDVAISGNGNFVAFSSRATNLVAEDTNGFTDMFVHDRTLGTTERVSVDSTGIEGDRGSVEPAISDDGRYVVFQSASTNLVVGDTNEVFDIFIHDRTTGATERVSVDSSNIEGNKTSLEPSVSSDGRYVAFTSSASNLVTGDTNDVFDVFIRDRTTGTTERMSVESSGVEGDSLSKDSAISDDGRYVAFQSGATNLVAGDTNGVIDIFVRDRTLGVITRMSVDSAGIEANGESDNFVLSPDGRYVAFSSEATNLVAGDINGFIDVFIRDRFDADSDDILDSIDTLPAASSADFSDVGSGGATTGSLVTQGDQTFITIKDSTLAAPNDGVLVSTGADLGALPAQISACPAVPVTVDVFSGSDVSITCASFHVGVENGAANLSFVIGGQPSTASLTAGNTIAYDPVTNTLSAPGENTGPVVVIVGGLNVSVLPGTSVPASDDDDDDDDDLDDLDDDDDDEDDDDDDDDDDEDDDDDRK